MTATALIPPVRDGDAEGVSDVIWLPLEQFARLIVVRPTDDPAPDAPSRHLLALEDPHRRFPGGRASPIAGLSDRIV